MYIIKLLFVPYELVRPNSFVLNFIEININLVSTVHILGYVIRREDVVHIIAVTNMNDMKHLKKHFKIAVRVHF